VPHKLNAIPAVADPPNNDKEQARTWEPPSFVTVWHMDLSESSPARDIVSRGTPVDIDESAKLEDSQSARLTISESRQNRLNRAEDADRKFAAVRAKGTETVKRNAAAKKLKARKLAADDPIISKKPSKTAKAMAIVKRDKKVRGKKAVRRAIARTRKAL
jgi:hypothetical protein